MLNIFTQRLVVYLLKRNDVYILGFRPQLTSNAFFSLISPSIINRFS